MAISTIDQTGLANPLSLTTPNLGTPSAINLSNATALPKAALPTGSVLQVVQGSTSTGYDVTSLSYVDIGLSASITPSSSSSKILVMFTVSADLIRQSNGIVQTNINIVRNSTQIAEKIDGYGGAAVSTTSFWYMPVNPSLNYLDSPATTSSITYKVQAKIGDTANGSAFRTQINGGLSTIILMEIAG